MKKVLTRILGIIFVLILGYQQFSYADVICIDPIEKFSSIAFLVGFICVIVLVISTISFFTLKSTINKQENLEIDSLNDEKIEKKKNRIQRRFYMWGMILSIIGLIYLRLSYEISTIIFFIPIILFIISFIVRLYKRKKISNIMCGISVVLVCIIALWTIISNKIIENYNEQFWQYRKIEIKYRVDCGYVLDVEGLINTAIKNNKSGRKVTLIYQNTNYISVDELKQLSSKLSIGKDYLMVIKYDNNHDYIESITLSSYDNLRIIDSLRSYEGEQKVGSSVKSLIQNVQAIATNYEEIKVIITYISDANQRTVNVSTDNSQEITNLKNEIKSGKTYKVEIQSDLDVWNIIITINN